MESGQIFQKVLSSVVQIIVLKILTLRGSGLLSIGDCICRDAWTYGSCSDSHARNQLLVTLNIRCYGCSKNETIKNLRSNLTESNTDFEIPGYACTIRHQFLRVNVLSNMVFLANETKKSTLFRFLGRLKITCVNKLLQFCGLNL